MSALAMNKSYIRVGLSVKPEIGTFNISDEGGTAIALLRTGPIPVLGRSSAGYTQYC